jgi:hypothetical protein
MGRESSGRERQRGKGEREQSTTSLERGAIPNAQVKDEEGKTE